jgi:hypothetical protein
VTRARTLEIALLGAVLASQAFLFARPIHAATNYDEGVYLAATDALRHGQALGSQVFAAQMPGFYDLLRGLSYVAPLSVVGLRAALLAVVVLGTVGGWLVGRRVGGAVGGLLAAALLTIAPPLDLFGSQVIADTPCLSLALLSLGLSTLGGTAAAALAGAVFGAALSVKLTALTVVPSLAWFLGRRSPTALAGAALVLGGDLLAHAGALGDLWESAITYHQRAGSTPAVIPHPHRQVLDQIPRTTPFFWFAVLGLVTATITAGRVLRRVWPLWLWVGLGLVFLLVYRPLHYNHLIVFPLTLAVATGATLGSSLERVAHGGVRSAAVGVLALAVAAGWVQQLHRVDTARTPEPASNVAAARALARLVPPNALVVDDRAIIAFLAHRRVVGQLVDTAYLRFETGSLTDAAVERDLRTAFAVVVSRAFRSRPAVLAYVRRNFRLRYAAGAVSIYLRRAGLPR